MAVSAATRASIFGYPGKTDRVTYTTPWGLKVVIHPLILQVFTEACEAAARHDWRPLRIDSYNNRPIRGKSGDKLEDWSLHASALAFDFFATPPGVPPPGGVWTPDDPPPAEFVACFTELGFRHGGTFDRVDLPHIEWAQGLPAPLTPAPPEEDDLPLNDADKQWLQGAIDKAVQIAVDEIRKTPKWIGGTEPVEGAPNLITVIDEVRKVPGWTAERLGKG